MPDKHKWDAKSGVHRSGARRLLFRMAERVGFEPTLPLRTLAVFKTALFNHLSTSPIDFRLVLQAQT